jgi:hypothetical protein
MSRIPPHIRLLTMRMRRPTLESHTDSDAHQNLWLGNALHTKTFGLGNTMRMGQCAEKSLLWMLKSMHGYKQRGRRLRKGSFQIQCGQETFGMGKQVNARVQAARQTIEKGKTQVFC